MRRHGRGVLFSITSIEKYAAQMAWVILSKTRKLYYHIVKPDFDSNPSKKSKIYYLHIMC